MMQVVQRGLKNDKKNGSMKKNGPGFACSNDSVSCFEFITKIGKKNAINTKFYVKIGELFVGGVNAK